jgi:hypothetical protein
MLCNHFAVYSSFALTGPFRNVSSWLASRARESIGCLGGRTLLRHHAFCTLVLPMWLLSGFDEHVEILAIKEDPPQRGNAHGV